MVSSAMEKSLEETFSFSFLLNDFLDFQQVMLMIDFSLAFSAKTEERAGWAFISNTCDRADEAGLAFIPLMNYNLGLLGLLRLLGKLFTNAGNQSFDSLVN